VKRYIEVECDTKVLNDDTIRIAAFFYVLENGELGPEYVAVNTMAWIVPAPNLSDLKDITQQIAEHAIVLQERLDKGII